MEPNARHCVASEGVMKGGGGGSINYFVCFSLLKGGGGGSINYFVFKPNTYGTKHLWPLFLLPES